MTERPPPLIVGAGPAGIRAAQTLSAAGLRPIVIDEAASPGGQIYRQRLTPDERSARTLYGSEAAKAERLHAVFGKLADSIDYRPNTLLWNLSPGRADIIHNGHSQPLAHDGLILATGATDRLLPLPGWTLPGVFTLGGAQIALKSQGCAIGSRVVFIGSGPLLTLVAWQYLRAGVDVAAVLDASPLSAKRHLAKAFAQDPRTILRGLVYGADLLRRGVKLAFGIDDVAILGTDRVTGITWRQGGRRRRLDCDGIGYGLALRSETQLADLAGCDFAFHTQDRAWLPLHDAAGRSSVPGVYLAGDGAGISGADAAERTGERAALSLLQDRNLPFDAARATALDHELTKIIAFRKTLEAVFPFPARWAASIADTTILCRCEDVTAADAIHVIRTLGITEINRLKAVSRIGMGRCQGRMCVAAAAELLAWHTEQPIEATGRLRAQAPVKPIPFAMTTDASA